MNNIQVLEKAKELIGKDIRRFVESDGGKIEAVKFENGILFVKMGGACKYCPALSLTLKGLVQKRLKAEIAEIESVEVIL